jgi:hypothetical protein
VPPPAPAEETGRGSLLASIQLGKKLKKTATTDKSGPLI